MRQLAVLGLALALAGCASLEGQRCPAGQERLQTAQLFFGRDVGDKPGGEAAFHKFVDAELTTRFPDGLTVLDGGGQWKGAENRLIRESAKVVLIVLPKGQRDAQARLDAVRQAYKARFRQDSVLLVTQPACVSF